jgi:SnoaL-like domain
MDGDQRLTSRLEIIDLVSRCIGAGDTGREEEFTPLFADEGGFEIGGRRSTQGAQQTTA